MALNTAHANNGVLIHAGECILLFCDNVNMEFSGQDSSPAFKNSKTGRLYLTTHRMIFNNKNKKDLLQSFSFPFVAMKDIELEQPIFSANYIKGRVMAQPNGNFTGSVKFKLHFNSGGAIDFGMAMLRAAKMASRNYVHDAPPPYTPPEGPWYSAPPPSYTANPNGYQGWIPPTNVFPHQPPADSVFMTDAPPPYPGINGQNGYALGGFADHGRTSTENSKAAEAAGASQTGFYDPNNPGFAYVPPPQSYEQPPSYDEANKKNQ